MPLSDFLIGFVIGAFVALAVLAVATNIGSDEEEDCGKDDQEGDDDEW